MAHRRQIIKMEKEVFGRVVTSDRALGQDGEIEDFWGPRLIWKIYVPEDFGYGQEKED